MLQTLDDDHDPDNGILITKRLRDAATSMSLDLDQSIATFATDPNVLRVVSELTRLTTLGERRLVSPKAAQDHLERVPRVWNVVRHEEA